MVKDNEDFRPFLKHKPQEVVDKLVETYPLLKDINPEKRELVVWKESEVILRTILMLKEIEVVALPTHDSIFVQQDNLEIAKRIHLEIAKRILADNYNYTRVGDRWLLILHTGLLEYSE